MVLQKAMKQGRNVHGIPPRDACSDVTSYNIKGVWPHWGTCLLRFCVQLHPLFFACSRLLGGATLFGLVAHLFTLAELMRNADWNASNV